LERCVCSQGAYVPFHTFSVWLDYWIRFFFYIVDGTNLLFFLVPEDTRVQLGKGIGAAGSIGLLLGYLLAMLAGCILGFFFGSRLALKLNLFLAWQQQNDRLSDAWGITASTLKGLFNCGAG
jgi:hypothetical protein